MNALWCLVNIYTAALVLIQCDNILFAARVSEVQTQSVSQSVSKSQWVVRWVSQQHLMMAIGPLFSLMFAVSNFFTHSPQSEDSALVQFFSDNWPYLMAAFFVVQIILVYVLVKVYKARQRRQWLQRAQEEEEEGEGEEEETGTSRTRKTSGKRSKKRKTSKTPRKSSKRKSRKTPRS